MGFTYHLLIGAVLLFISWRSSPSSAQNVPAGNSSIAAKNASSINSIVTEKQPNIKDYKLNIVSDDKTKLHNVPKTETSTEIKHIDSKDIDVKNNILQTQNQIESASSTEIETEPSNSAESVENDKEETSNKYRPVNAGSSYIKYDRYGDVRHQNGRSIDVDINKYGSPEFHTKNNVYTVPLSQHYEKYVKPDFEYFSSTHRIPSYQHDEFKFDLTTPKTEFFDNKFRETVDNINQKLEYIDDIDVDASEEHEDDHEKLLDDSKEIVDLDKLIDDVKNNETKTSLDYQSFKKLVSESAKDKRSKSKDSVAEAGTHLDFRSSYNKTEIIGDEPEDHHEENFVSKEDQDEQASSHDAKSEQEKVLTTSARPIFSSTKKSLTKRPSYENNSHIISNKIETENVIRKTNILSTTADPIVSKLNTDYSIEPTAASVSHKEASSPQSTTSVHLRFSKNKTVEENKINKTIEQAVLENQVIPIQLSPNSTTENYKLISSNAFAPKIDINITENPTTYSSSREKSEEVTHYSEVNTDNTETASVPTTLEVTTLSNLETTTNSIHSNITTENVETTSNKETTTLAYMTEMKTLSSPTDNPQEVTGSTTIEDQGVTEIHTEINTEISESSTITKLYTTIVPTTDMPTETTDEETTTIDGFSHQTTLPSVNNSPSTQISETSAVMTTTVEPMAIVSSETMKMLESTTPFVSTTEQVLQTSTVLPDKATTETATSTTELPSTSPTTGVIGILTPSTTSDFEVRVNLTTFFPDNTYPYGNISGKGRSASPEPSALPSPSSTSPSVLTITPSEDNATTVTASSTNDELTTQPEEGKGTVIAIAISSVGCFCLVALAALLIIMRKRQKRFNYLQRCTPVGLDDYSVDNVSVYNSVRRKGALRASKRSYGNPAFEDPASISHPLNFPAITKFSNNLEDIKAEFEDIPQIVAKTTELPEGCDTKNRYANVIPLPETRVFLQPIEGYANSDYINANYVTGSKNVRNYYIATQAPLQDTIDDFWRMIWEEQCKVILMLTQLYENGVEKCADYLPPSEVLDCHRLFGDFQVTLKKREVKDKYIISSLQLKNMVSNSWREVTHFWYLGWPEKGIPQESNSLIAFLIEARSYMKASTIDKKEATNGNLANGTSANEVHPVVVHCSPGTGRTGAVIACDIAIREFEQTRLVDIPKIVYRIRRDRASSVQTKEQYAFIYKVINLYAAKLTGGSLDSL